MPMERGELRRIVNESLKEALEHRAELRKNGETWKTYVFRVFTIDRVIMTVVLLVTLGRTFSDAQHQLSEAIDRANTATQLASTASQQATVASRKADDAAQALEGARTELAGVVADLQRQSALESDLKERVALSVTRSEFSSALAQQILPRLERIEQRLWENRPR